jgi:hypothetical protein
MADINKVIIIDVEDKASTSLATINTELEQVDTNIKKVDTSTDKLTSSQKKNTQGVLENGGAMGLLNDLTGGYAMMVKDAVEASSLFGKESKIAAGIQTAYSAVVGTSTGAMKLFKLALAGTGIGLIVIALGALVANFDTVVKYVQMGIDKFKGMGEGAKLLVSVLFPIVGVVRLITAALEEMGVIDDDATKKAKKNAEERIKALDKDRVKIEEKYNSEIRLAAAAGKDTVELEAAKRKAILQTLLALNDAEKARIKSGEATADEIKRWNERQKEIKKVVEDGKVAVLEQERDREQKSKEIADKAAEKKTTRIEKEKETEKKRQDDIKKLNEDYTKQLQDLDVKTDEEKLKLERSRKEAQLNNLKATNEEKLALKALYDRKEEDLEKKKQENIQNITNEYSNKLRDLNAKTDQEKFDLALVKQQEEEDKKIAELEKLGATEAEKKAIKDYYIALEAQTKVDFDLAQEEKRKADVEKRKSEAETFNQEMIAQEERLQAAKRNALDSGLAFLTLFAGKNKAIALGILAVQKGLAIADIVTNASKSIATQTAANSAAIIATNAFYAPFGPVGVPLAAAQNLKNNASFVKGVALTKVSAGINIASILATGIQGAKSITGGGGDSGGGAAGGGGGGAAPQAPTFNVVGSSGVNQLAQTIAGQGANQAPIQAYVVSGQVTTAQSLDRNRIENSTMG